MLNQQWHIEMLGGLRARSGDRTVGRFQTQKTGALGSANVGITGSLTVTGATSTQGLNATSLTTPSATMTAATITSGSIGTATVTTLNVTSNATFNAPVTMNNTGGNVPFSCVTRVQTGSYNTACAANEIAVGGGGRCTSLWRLTESLPWNGPNDTDGAPGSGSVARAWRSVVWWTGFPALGAGWMLDRALGPLLRRKGWSNTYRVLARRSA